MWEEYYKPLPDADKYLKRIGVERREELTKEYLDKLVFAHQCAVPFESTNISEYNLPVLIDTDSLYKKIVEDKRGGYCFELNGAFVLLLQALGFDAWSCPCRVLLGAPAQRPLPPVLHRGNIVRIGDKMYFCDVGFGGPMPMGAVEINDGEMQEIRGEKFAVKPFEHGKYILVRENSDGQEETVLFISKAKWEPVDFIAPNMFCAMPGSFFASRQASMRTHDGYISLKGDVYSVSKNGITEKKEVTDEEGKEILKSVFGL